MATKRKKNTSDTADTAEVDVPDLSGAKPSAIVTVRNISHRAINGVGSMTKPLEVGATTKVSRAFAEDHAKILEIVEDHAKILEIVEDHAKILEIVEEG